MKESYSSGKKNIINEGFSCANCDRWAPFNLEMGTSYRNHCPFCLYSLHVDLKVSGDRKAACKGKMKPIGLIFKNEGNDKWGKPKQGELMLTHKCLKCGSISINRIAGDDDSCAILDIFYQSCKQKEQINDPKIRLLSKKDKQKVKDQLFGKKHKAKSLDK